jgi:hypothetical protein
MRNLGTIEWLVMVAKSYYCFVFGIPKRSINKTLALYFLLSVNARDILKGTGDHSHLYNDNHYQKLHSTTDLYGKYFLAFRSKVLRIKRKRRYDKLYEFRLDVKGNMYKLNMVLNQFYTYHHLFHGVMINRNLWYTDGYMKQMNLAVAFEEKLRITSLKKIMDYYTQRSEFMRFTTESFQSNKVYESTFSAYKKQVDAFLSDLNKKVDGMDKRLRAQREQEILRLGEEKAREDEKQGRFNDAIDRSGKKTTDEVERMLKEQKEEQATFSKMRIEALDQLTNFGSDHFSERNRFRGERAPNSSSSSQRPSGSGTYEDLFEE